MGTVVQGPALADTAAKIGHSEEQDNGDQESSRSCEVRLTLGRAWGMSRTGFFP
jgi:hypothetical protein